MALFVSILVILSCQSLLSQTAGQQTSPSEKNPKAVEFIKRALVLEDAGMLHRAIDTYKEVLKVEPKDFAAMNTIAGLYGKLELPIEEVLWAKKSIETNPSFFQAYINYGNGFAMQGKFEEANKAYQDAAKLAPKSPLPIYGQGVVAENQRRMKDALEFYKRSVEIDPKFENGLFSAAAMHANIRQFAEAKILLNKLLQLNPRDEDARQMLAAVEREKPQ